MKSKGLSSNIQTRLKGPSMRLFTHEPNTSKEFQYQPFTVKGLSGFETNFIKVLMFLAPLTFIGATLNVSVIGRDVFFPLFPFMGFACGLIAMRYWKFAPFSIFVPFMMVATLSTYVGIAPLRGAFNLFLISGSAIGALAITSLLRAKACDWRDLIRPMIISSVVMSTIALAQSLLANVFGLAINMDIVGFLVPGANLRPLSFSEGIWRAQGLYSEPMHFAIAILPACGFAGARMGVFGTPLKIETQKLMSKLSAYLILVGLVASFSLVAAGGLVALVGTVFTLTLLSQRRQSLWRILLIGVSLIVVAFLVVASPVGTNLQVRLESIPLGIQYYMGDTSNAADTNSLSILSLAVNGRVATEALQKSPALGFGVGSHPLTYDEFLPPWVEAAPSELLGLQSMDAGALLFRLLSETGLLGTIAWLIIPIAAVRRCLCWHAQNRAMRALRMPDRMLMAVAWRSSRIWSSSGSDLKMPVLRNACSLPSRSSSSAFSSTTRCW